MGGKRGGFRKGAGRKKMADGEKKVPVATRLAPDVIAILRNAQMPIAQHIEEAVRAFNADGYID